jgi:hypothetical protein
MQEDKATQVDGDAEFSVLLPSGLSVGRASAGVSAPERSGPLDPAWSPAPAPAESSVVRSELEQER